MWIPVDGGEDSLLDQTDVKLLNLFLGPSVYFLENPVLVETLLC